MDTISLHVEDLTLEEIKAYLKKLHSYLLSKHLQGESGISIMRAYTGCIDSLLKNLYTTYRRGSEKGFCLVAMGGYGRGELNPRSDIDIMLLYEKRLTPEIEALGKDLFYTLWDAGLDVGFSVRSIQDCLALVKEDLKTMTALLDSRFLLGEEGIYQTLMEGFKEKVLRRHKKRFIEEKIRESKTRHERYGDSVYILEPNVKEGKGGLRDIHTLIWIGKVGEGIDGWDGFVTKGFLREEGRREIETSMDFLCRIRNDLHFHSRKKMDQLTFDAQERIAELLGYTALPSASGVERFMGDYYFHASRISRYTSMLTSRLLHRPERGIVWRLRSRSIDKAYRILKGMIFLEDEAILNSSPSLLIKAFQYSQRFNLPLHPHTREAIIRNLRLVDEGFRRSPEVNRIFLEILKGKGDVYRVLEEMHSTGFLGTYIPEFKDITHRVQHDLYHIYTVDIHSLFAVKELEYLLSEEGKKAFPLLSSLLEEVERFDLLLLGVLFHDIGKVGGKGHAERGERIAADIGRRMGLTEEEVDLLSFLVRNHLLLPDLAQYRDIHDLKLIVEFAKTVGNIERLDMLYLLTFADVRAVGPGVWNQWKAALFQELYFRTRKVIEKGTFEIPGVKDILREKKRALMKLVAGRFDEKEVDSYMERFPSRYFIYNFPEDIALHMGVLSELDGRDLVVHIRHNMERVYTEVIICTYDTYGLFSKITGVMAANGVNILGAQINTSKDGIALDILQVNSSIGEVIKDERKWRRVEEELRDVLKGRLDLEELVKRCRPSLLDRRAVPTVPTRVEIDNEISNEFTVIDVNTQDRIGLLYDITRTLTDLGLDIHLARITTRGNEAADVFYVKDTSGNKVVEEDRMDKIKGRLIEVLKPVKSERDLLTDTHKGGNSLL